MLSDSFFEPNPELEKSIISFKEKRKKGKAGWYEVEELLPMIDHSLDIPMGDDTDAMEMIDYGLQLHPEDTQLLILKAKLYIGRKDIESAGKITSSLSENYSKDVKLLFAEIALEQKEVEKADSIISELLNGDFDIDEEDYQEIITLYTSVREDEKAINYLQKALLQFPKSFTLRRRLVCYYATLRKSEEGERVLKELLDENPYSVEDWYSLAANYSLTKNYEKAIEACEFGLAIDPDFNDFYFLLGGLYVNLENYEKALQVFITFAEKTPFIPLPYLYIGEVYLLMNEIKKAEESFEKLLSDKKYNYHSPWELYYKLAIGYYNNDKYYKSIECLNRSMERSPDQVEPILFKGIFYHQIGDPDKAYEMFMKVLKMEKFTIESYIKIMTLYAELKDYKQVSNILKVIRDREPDNPEIIKFSAFYYYMVNQEKDFLIWFRRLLKEYPDTFDELLDLVPEEDEERHKKLVEYREMIEKE